MLQRFAELRIPNGVRIGEIDEARRLSCDRAVEWADVKVTDLISRKNRKSPGSANNAGDIVGLVEVGRDAAPIPDPNPRYAAPLFYFSERIGLGKIGQDFRRWRG